MKGFCELCGKWEELEVHHLWAGALRPVSDRYGMTVRLCAGCHRENADSAHKSGATRIILQKAGEREFLRRGGTVEEFISLGFKNVLDPDEVEEILHPVRYTGTFSLIEEAALLPY